MTNDNEILALFQDWNNAVQERDTKRITALYAADAILLPTVSNQVRHSHTEIEAYFVSFTAREPVGKINEANIRLLGDIAINSGVYTFTFADGLQVQARFTFVYRNTADGWKIIEHHSSRMPE